MKKLIIISSVIEPLSSYENQNIFEFEKSWL